MRFVTLACLATFTLVGVVVGLRLLGLARQTRQLPETLMGVGLLLVATVGAPLSGAGRAPALVGTPLGDALFSWGLAFVQVGIGCFYAFTWHVFRKQSHWAMAFVLVACGALGATWQGLVGASHGATMDEIYAHTRPWAMGVVSLVALAFTWTAVESLRYSRKLARRLALGLVEPEIANRVWLWGVGASAIATLCSLMLIPMYRGVPPLQDTTILVLMALGASISTACWFFAFFPPKAYLERVRAQAA